MADKSSDQYAKSGASSFYQDEARGDRQQSTSGSAAQQMQDISNQIETAKERIKATNYASALHILRSLPNNEDDKIQLDCLFLVALCETMTEQNISENTNMKILSLCHRLSFNWQELWKMARNASGSLEVVFTLYTVKLLVSQETPDAALRQINECINRTHPAINAMITKGGNQEAHKLVSIMHAILKEARKVTGCSQEIRIHTQAKCLNKIGLLYNRLSMYGTAIEYLHEGRISMENFFGQRVAQYSIYSEMLGNIAAAYAGEAEYSDASLYYDKAYKNLQGNKTVPRLYREKYLQSYEVEFRKNIMSVYRKDPDHARNLQQSSSFRDSDLLPKITSDTRGADKKAGGWSGGSTQKAPDQSVPPTSYKGTSGETATDVDRQTGVGKSGTVESRQSLSDEYGASSREPRMQKRENQECLTDVGNGIYVDHTQPMKSGCKVYKGKFHGEDVAVKRADFNEKTKKAIEVVKSLKRHHNVLQYKASSEWESKDMPGLKSIYIVMELCETTTLRELAKRKIYTHKERLMMLRQVIDGICHLHSNGVIHGGLRPDRILRSYDGRNMKISDAGLSTRGNTSSFARGIERETPSKKSDIYSAGLIFYYVLSGGERPQYDHSGIKIVELSCEDACVATELITRMTDKDPEKRPNAEKCRDDMLFWDCAKKLCFIVDFYDVVSKRQRDSVIMKHVNETSPEILGDDWTKKLRLTESEKNRINERSGDQERKVDDRVIIDMAERAFLGAKKPTCPLMTLLHFIKVRDRSLPREGYGAQVIFGNQDELWSFFNERFPKLLMKVHQMEKHLSARLAKTEPDETELKKFSKSVDDYPVKAQTHGEANVAPVEESVGGSQSSLSASSTPQEASLTDVGNGIQVDFTKELSEDPEVYPGKFKETDVAVKKLKSSPESQREIDIMTKLGSHPNIIEYKASSEREESTETHGVKFIYVAMELCGQETLYELAHKQSFNHQHRVEGLLQIAYALSHIHENNFVQRDLNPHKILRSSDGNSLKIADFGKSEMVQDGGLHGVPLRRSSSITDEWKAPEPEVSQMADVYSFGLLILFVLSGGTLQEPESVAKLSCPDGEIAIDLISRMLEKDPSARPTIDRIMDHAIFMDNIKKLEFCFEVYKKCQKDTVDDDDDALKDWAQKLTLTDKEQRRLSTGREQNQEISGTRNILVEKAEKYKYDKRGNLLSLIHFMGNCYDDSNKEGNLLRDLFGSKSGVWDFFCARFPNLFILAYRCSKRQSQSTSPKSVHQSVDHSTNPTIQKTKPHHIHPKKEKRSSTVEKHKSSVNEQQSSEDLNPSKGTIRATEERSSLQYKDVESESFSSEIEEIIRTPRKIRVDVATAGRTIELHGCKLKFPTGAFEETTPVEMVVGSQGAMPDGDLVPFTPILTCKLFGAQPKLPVAVEMPVYCLVDNDASIVVMCCKRHSNEWIHIKGAVMNTTNQTIEFEVAHFCTFAGYFRKMMKGMSMFSSRYNLHHQLYYNREKVAFIAMTYISTKEDENYKKPLEKPEVEQLMDLPHIISAKSGDKIKVKLMCGVPLEPPESPIPDPDDLLEKKYDLKYIVLKHKQIPHGCQTFMKYVIKINEEIREEKTLPSPLIPPSVPGQPDDNRGYHTDDIAEFNLKPAERHDYERHHEDSQYYQIPDHKVKGKVLILNNFFFGNQEMARVGSEIDVKKMTTLWTALGLNVTMKPNMSAEMMRNEVKSFAQNIGEVCLCVVIIMSHGLEQRGKVAIMCEDSTVVLFEEIIRQFDDDICAHLRGVPKLFFFDCDCGDRVLTQDTAGPVTEPPPPRQDTEPPPPRQHSEWPNNDRLVANAMRRTFVAFRNEAVGGWFIDAITNIFKEKACNTSVSDMMNLVNNAVSQRSCTDWACPQVYQMPQYESTLQKVLFLFPGWPKATYPLKDLGPTIQETEKHPIHTENKSKPPMLKRRSSSTISPSSDMQPTAEELSTFLVAVIDPGGGSVGLHGCSISVPEGSFSHSSNVKLSVYTGHDSLPAKYLLVSPVIHCASELPLKKSVTLQLPLWVSSKDPTVKIRIVRKGDEDNAEWEEIQTFNLCEISQRMIQVECRLSWAAAIMELLFGRVDYHIKTNLYHDMEGNFTTVFHFDEDTLAEKFRKQMIEKGKKCSPPTFKNHTVHLNDKITFSMTVEPEEYTFDFDKHEFHITEDFLHNKYASRDSMIEPDPTSIKTAVKFETNINGKKEDYGSFRINWNVQSAAASAPPSIINAQNVVTGPGHIRSTAESCTSLVKKS